MADDDMQRIIISIVNKDRKTIKKTMCIISEHVLMLLKKVGKEAYEVVDSMNVYEEDKIKVQIVFSKNQKVAIR